MNFVLDLKKLISQRSAPLITLNKIAISAIMSRMWIKPPALYAKKPIAQAITRITAIK